MYDIRPGNGAGLFLQPRSPHGVHISFDHNTKFGCCVHAMCVQAGGPEILRDAGAPPPWDGGVADPVDISS